MIKSKIYFLILLFLISNQIVTAQEKITLKGRVDKNSELIKVGSGFTFTEGPAVNRIGDVFFTDQPNNQILKWEASTGKISVFSENSGRSNGMFFDRFENLITCADEYNELWSFDKNGNPTTLINSFQSKKLNGPNDLWISPNGAIYITDPYYERQYWSGETQNKVKGENLYFYSADKTQFFIVDDMLVKPNGIIGTPDGKKLYVSDLGAQKTYQYDIEEDGYLSNKKLFAPMGSDGMTIDNQGNVYLTGKGVTVFNSKGKNIGHIPIDEVWTSNVCFGAYDRKTLFITAMGSVYTLKMKVRGVY
jgi:gluconolactonase